MTDGDATRPGRPNPRPAGPRVTEPRVTEPRVAEPRVADPRPKPRRRQLRPPIPPGPGPTAARGPEPAAAPTSDDTVAVPVAVSERVLVGAGGLHQPADSSSVFALDTFGPPVEPIDLELPGDFVRIPRRSGWMRRLLIVLVIFGLVAGVSGAAIGRWLHSQIHPDGNHGELVELTIEQGQATNTVANNLTANGVVANGTVFRYWLRRQGGEQTFQAGDYDLFKHMDYPELLTALRAGPKPPVQIKVTIPPGLTIDQMQKVLLDKLPGFDPEELKRALLAAQLDAPYVKLRSPIREGLLFPDTYNVDEDASSNEVALLTRMRVQMDKVLKDLNAEARAADLGYSVYDVLKVASLIEEEAKVETDRPKIARVIYNRLAKNMSLGIDASTRFAVGKTNGERLTVSDLSSDSPYNMRKALGLPPTPISLPGKTSIDAALNPTPDAKWLYYALTDDNGVKGAHTFATTNAEFNAAVKVCQQLKYCD